MRDGFIALGNGYDTGLVSLELALLYQKQGRTEEIQELARAILPVFRTQDTHREALAALALSIETAISERVSEQFLSRLTQYLVYRRGEILRSRSGGDPGAASTRAAEGGRFSGQRQGRADESIGHVSAETS